MKTIKTLVLAALVLSAAVSTTKAMQQATQAEPTTSATQHAADEELKARLNRLNAGVTELEEMKTKICNQTTGLREAHAMEQKDDHSLNVADISLKARIELFKAKLEAIEAEYKAIRALEKKLKMIH